MNNLLDRVLFEWQYGDYFSIRNAAEGVLITGGIGSGKTSASGNLIAGHYLRNGFGGTVLTAKPDEVDLWRKYCRQFGRENDLIIIGPDSGQTFNFMEYESDRGDKGKEIANNIADVLLKVIKAGYQDSSGSDKAFWDSSLEELVVNAVDLCLLTGNKRFEHIYEIVQSAPKTNEQKKSPKWRKNSKCYRAMAHVAYCLEEMEETPFVLERTRRLDNIEDYFLYRWINLAEKTRSIVDQMFSAFGSRFMREPLYSLFNTTTTVTPEDAIKGKIILIDLPYLLYDKIGRDAQILWKYIFQRAMQRRKIKSKSRPVFIWVDEAHYFLHENDIQFQSTTRSSRVCTVYITQNLPNFYLNCGGGELGKTRFKALAGNLSTKFFHANSDMETNEFAADLIGKDWHWSANEGMSMGEKMSISSGHSETMSYIVEPSDFTKLMTGGPNNNFHAQAIVHRQGKSFEVDIGESEPTYNSYKVVTLKQNVL